MSTTRPATSTGGGSVPPDDSPDCTGERPLPREGGGEAGASGEALGTSDVPGVCPQWQPGASPNDMIEAVTTYERERRAASPLPDAESPIAALLAMIDTATHGPARLCRTSPGADLVEVARERLSYGGDVEWSVGLPDHPLTAGGWDDEPGHMVLICSTGNGSGSEANARLLVALWNALPDLRRMLSSWQPGASPNDSGSDADALAAVEALILAVATPGAEDDDLDAHELVDLVLARLAERADMMAALMAWRQWCHAAPGTPAESDALDEALELTSQALGEWA